MEFLERYSRTILLNDVDYNGQLAISSAKVLLVGGGGISTSVFPILVASGVKQITIFEGDNLELSNLQRQFLFKESEIGEAKSNLLKNFANTLNSGVLIQNINKMLTEETYEEFLNYAKECNLIIDGTDSFLSRSLCNKAAILNNIPFFTGAATGFNGQVYSFFSNKTLPCYACLYGHDYINFKDEKTCINIGVLPSLPALIGSLIAQNVLLFLTKKMNKNFFEKLILLDFLKEKFFREVKITKEPNCQICSKN